MEYLTITDDHPIFGKKYYEFYGEAGELYEVEVDCLSLVATVTMPDGEFHTGPLGYYIRHRQRLAEAEGGRFWFWLKRVLACVEFEIQSNISRWHDFDNGRYPEDI